MAAQVVSNIKRNFLIIVLITVAVILVIALLHSRKLTTTFFDRSKASILPITNTPPRKTPFQRHLPGLRM